MSSRLLLTLVLAFTLLWITACDGCASRQEETNLSRKPAPHRPQFHVKAEDLGPLDVSVLRYAGKVDFGNRYASAVMVTTGAPEQGAQCSGVLIGPRLALTAGSCVCKPRSVAPGGEGRFVIDGAACSERAHVMAVVYGRVLDAHTADMELRSYAAAVRPHPELRVHLDAHSTVVTSHADLAVLVLETPVKEGVPFAALADSAVRDGEPLIAAGYGHDEAVEQSVGERYFRVGRIEKGAAGERFTVMDPEVDAHANHDGWPCFRESEGRRWLLGISSQDSREGNSCVSTFFYREWLNDEIQRAAKHGGK